MSTRSVRQIKLLRQVQALEIAEYQRRMANAVKREAELERQNTELDAQKNSTRAWMGAPAVQSADLSLWRQEIGQRYLDHLFETQSTVNSSLEKARQQLAEQQALTLSSKKKDEALEKVERSIQKVELQNRASIEQHLNDEAWLQSAIFRRDLNEY